MGAAAGMKNASMEDVSSGSPRKVPLHHAEEGDFLFLTDAGFSGIYVGVCSYIVITGL